MHHTAWKAILKTGLTSLVFLGQGWLNPEERKKKLNMADKNASVKKTHIYTGVPTTSSMMGSGLAASN